MGLNDGKKAKLNLKASEDAFGRGSTFKRMKGENMLIPAMFLIIIMVIAWTMINIPFFKETAIAENDVETRTEIHTMGNALDAAKLYAETALEYSIYQACFDNLKNGGWKDIPQDKKSGSYALWDDSNIGPGTTDFEEGMQSSIMANLNLYRASTYRFLSDNFVTIPSYDTVNVFTDGNDPKYMLVTAFSQGNLNIQKNQESGEYIRLEKDSSITNDDVYKVDCYGVYQKGIEIYSQEKDLLENFLMGLDTSIDLSLDQANFRKGVKDALNGGWADEQTFTWDDGDYSVTAEVLQADLVKTADIAGSQYSFKGIVKVKFEIQNDTGNEFPVYDGAAVTFQPMKLIFVMNVEKEIPLKQTSLIRLQKTSTVNTASMSSLSFAGVPEEEMCYDEDECGYVAECAITSYSEDGSVLEEMDCPMDDPCCTDAVQILQEDGWTVEGSCCIGETLPSGDVISFGVKKGKKAVKVVVTPQEKERLQIIAAKYAKIWEVPKELVFAVIQKESGWNSAAEGKSKDKGLMQLTPITVKHLAETYNMAECQRNLFIPEINLNCGTFYLKKLLERYEDDEEMALAAFNAGPTKVSKIQSKYCQKEPGYDCVKKYLKPKTLSYVPKVLEYKQQYAALISSGAISV